VKAHREAAVLRHLEGHGFAGRSPRLVYEAEFGGWVALVESIVAGRPIAIRMRQDGHPDSDGARADFTAVIPFLSELRSMPLVPGGPAETSFDAAATIESFERTFEVSGDERRLLQELGRASTKLGRPGPILHGDFCRQNVLVCSGQPLAAVDWSDSEAWAPPAEDFLFFVTTYFVQARAAGFGTLTGGFEATYLDDNAYSSVVRSAFAAYCAAADTEPDLRLHLALLLLRQTVRHAERMALLSERQTLPRFTVWLAAAEGLPFERARRMSMWRHYFARLSTQPLAA
jgi:aminoglycoside phosphotransferase (APT) family kinase protein